MRSDKDGRPESNRLPGRFNAFLTEEAQPYADERVIVFNTGLFSPVPLGVQGGTYACSRAPCEFGFDHEGAQIPFLTVDGILRAGIQAPCRRV